MKRRRAIAVGLIAVASAAPAAPPPPAQCLPPRRTSCRTEPKKDPSPERRTPSLRRALATIVHVHTREAIVLDLAPSPDEPALVARFLRDRTSWEEHPIAVECVATLRNACLAFGATRAEVVSGFRSDKLNESLRKKGRQVARRSEHTRGNAIDFRLVGVSTQSLRQFVRETHRGGIGFYMASGFVHIDAGRPRTWSGE